MNNIVNELKDMRNKISIFKGMEQIVKLNEEVKEELMGIRKINAMVERHADKVETIFSEMQKRFSDFERFNDTVKDLDKSFKQISSDFDSIKIKMTDLASKKELENLVSKVNDFENHTSNVLNLINKKFNKLKEDLEDEFKENLMKARKLLHGFEELVQKTPDLNKYFDLLEREAQKSPKENVKVEKIKEPGQEEKDEGSTKEEKKNFFSKIKERFSKK
jgi:uncharacterized phage infection (PIP) family protein YhgE